MGEEKKSYIERKHRDIGVPAIDVTDNGDRGFPRTLEGEHARRAISMPGIPTRSPSSH